MRRMKPTPKEAYPCLETEFETNGIGLFFNGCGHEDIERVPYIIKLYISPDLVLVDPAVPSNRGTVLVELFPTRVKNSPEKGLLYIGSFRNDEGDFITFKANYYPLVSGLFIYAVKFNTNDEVDQTFSDRFDKAYSNLNYENAVAITFEIVPDSLVINRTSFNDIYN